MIENGNKNKAAKGPGQPTRGPSDERAEMTTKLKDSQGSRRPTEKRLVIICALFFLLVVASASRDAAGPKIVLAFSEAFQSSEYR